MQDGPPELPNCMPSQQNLKNPCKEDPLLLHRGNCKTKSKVARDFHTLAVASKLARLKQYTLATQCSKFGNKSPHNISGPHNTEHEKRWPSSSRGIRATCASRRGWRLSGCSQLGTSTMK